MKNNPLKEKSANLKIPENVKENQGIYFSEIIKLQINKMSLIYTNLH